MAAVKKMSKIKSLNDLRIKAKDDERYQKLAIAGLSNLGCEHLAIAERRYTKSKWEAYYGGLMSYVSSLVGEYGVSESKAFREVRDEVNNVIDCIDNVNLEWGEPKKSGKSK